MLSLDTHYEMGPSGTDEYLQTFWIVRSSGLVHCLNVGEVSTVDGLVGTVEDVGCWLTSSQEEEVFNVV